MSLTPAPGEQYNPYRLFTGGHIPEWLMRQANVSPGAKVCFAALCRFAGEDGECFPSMDALGLCIGSSERQARYYVEELIDFGLVHSRRRGRGLTNIFTFHWHPAINDKFVVLERQDLAGQERQNIAAPERQDLAGPIEEEESHSRESVEKTRDLSDKNNTPFEGMQVQIDPNLPTGTVEFRQGNRVVGSIVNLGTPIDPPRLARAIKSRINRVHGSRRRLNRSHEREIESWLIGKADTWSDEQVMAALEDFESNPYWLTYDKIAPAFKKHAEKFIESSASSKPHGTSREETGRQRVAEAPANGHQPETSPTSPECPQGNERPAAWYVETWNRLVPEAAVDWDPARDPVARLKTCMADQKFCAEFERLCEICKGVHVREGDGAWWLDFYWLIGAKDGIRNWIKVLRKNFGRAPTPTGRRSGDGFAGVEAR